MHLVEATDDDAVHDAVHDAAMLVQGAGRCELPIVDDSDAQWQLAGGAPRRTNGPIVRSRLANCHLPMRTLQVAAGGSTAPTSQGHNVGNCAHECVRSNSTAALHYWCT